MAKIVFTLDDYGAASHYGTATERESFVVEIPDDELPDRVREAIEWRRDHDMNDIKGPQRYDTISLSLIYT